MSSDIFLFKLFPLAKPNRKCYIMRSYGIPANANPMYFDSLISRLWNAPRSELVLETESVEDTALLLLRT